MKLRNICEDLAKSLLGKPGTFVERMRDGYYGDIVKGEVYRVVGAAPFRGYIILEGVSSYCARNFRKVIEK